MMEFRNEELSRVHATIMEGLTAEMLALHTGMSSAKTEAEYVIWEAQFATHCKMQRQIIDAFRSSHI